MVHEWLWYLTESGLTRRNLQPGETLQISRPPNTSNGGAAVESPDGLVTQVVGRDEQGRSVFRYALVPLPGAYNMKVSGEKLGAEKFWVNRDPQGSDFTPLDEAQLTSLRDTAGVGFGSEPFAQVHTTATRIAQLRPRLWPRGSSLVFSALLVCETLMAFWLDSLNVWPPRRP